MIFHCPKCGKKIELSIEAQMAAGFHTVCPQCLTRLQIVGDTAVVPADNRNQSQTKKEATPVHATSQVPQPAAIRSRQVGPTTRPAPVNVPPLPPRPPQYHPRRTQVAPKAPACRSPQAEKSAPFQQQLRRQQNQKDDYLFSCTSCIMWLIIVSAILILFSQLVSWIMS